jgi:hypothetical protein
MSAKKQYITKNGQIRINGRWYDLNKAHELDQVFPRTSDGHTPDLTEYAEAAETIPFIPNITPREAPYSRNHALFSGNLPAKQRRILQVARIVAGEKGRKSPEFEVIEDTLVKLRTA